jgi:hypothetical protein
MMKRFVFLLSVCYSLLVLSATACKSIDKTNPAAAPPATTPAGKPKTTGKVSHAWPACGTVVVVPDANGGDPMILIPNDPLGALDVEGTEISFYYHPLKRKNPDGCMKGFPASLYEISKK